MSDQGSLLIQANFQALQLYSWGFAMIKLFRSKQASKQSEAAALKSALRCVLATQQAETMLATEQAETSVQ